MFLLIIYTLGYQAKSDYYHYVFNTIEAEILRSDPLIVSSLRCCTSSSLRIWKNLIPSDRRELLLALLQEEKILLILTTLRRFPHQSVTK